MNTNNFNDIYLVTLISYTYFVCMVVSNKRQNGWTDQAWILCGTSHDPREGLLMRKISKISHQQNSISIELWKFRTFSYKLFCRFCFELHPSILNIIKLIKNLRIYWVRCRLLQPYYKNNRVLLRTNGK